MYVDWLGLYQLYYTGTPPQSTWTPYFVTWVPGAGSGVIVTPEPASLALLGVGLLGVGGGVWRRRRR
jgi:hypothetical protein